ncbi:MAG TPA: hypothetical protein VKP68_05170 [Ramlibacter sp.]|nr:hypothetical protein [Ramlibacter sp.]
MRQLFKKSAAAATMGALMLGAAFGQVTPTLPAVQKSGQVEYLTGGIGLDQSTAIERVSKQWPLTLEFAVKDKARADFAADVKTVVRDAKGHPVMQVDSAGPFLLAKLEPGRYSVDASLAGKTLHESVVVKRGEAAKAVFLWPAGTDSSRS